MAKPLKYPKKFRAKLEKMRNDRTEREDPDAARRAAFERFDRDSRTLYRDLLSNGQAEGVYMDMTENPLQMRVTYQIVRKRRMSDLEIEPPWSLELASPS